MHNKYPSIENTHFQRIRESCIVLEMTHKITIFFPKSSCPKYILPRSLFWFLGEDRVQMEEVVWNQTVNKENTSVIFFKLFHLTKTQKGEKIIYKKTMCQQDLILKMFSEKDSLISVSFRTTSHRRGRSHMAHCTVEEQRSHSCRSSGHSLAKWFYSCLHFI